MNLRKKHKKTKRHVIQKRRDRNLRKRLWKKVILWKPFPLMKLPASCIAKISQFVMPLYTKLCLKLTCWKMYKLVPFDKKFGTCSLCKNKNVLETIYNQLGSSQVCIDVCHMRCGRCDSQIAIQRIHNTHYEIDSFGPIFCLNPNYHHYTSFEFMAEPKLVCLSTIFKDAPEGGFFFGELNSFGNLRSCEDI
jgi:hypothetical protein